ncbi:MAG: (Fe-S)-binding protein [Candidatus Altiarchaeota archaeon]
MDDEKDFALRILQHLPGKNCGMESPCGLPKCRMFAVKLVRDEKKMGDCPYIEEPQRQSIAVILDEFFN